MNDERLTYGQQNGADPAHEASSAKLATEILVETPESQTTVGDDIVHLAHTNAGLTAILAMFGSL